MKTSVWETSKRDTARNTNATSLLMGVWVTVGICDLSYQHVAKTFVVKASLQAHRSVAAQTTTKISPLRAGIIYALFRRYAVMMLTETRPFALAATQQSKLQSTCPRDGRQRNPIAVDDRAASV